MVRSQSRQAGCSHSWWIIVQLLPLAFSPSLVVGDTSGKGLALQSSPPLPPPPRPLPVGDPSQGSEATTNDAIQVIETEVWDGENWIGPESISRWTTVGGQSCVSPAEIEAPDNGKYEGDWKIVLGDDRDEYGWKYVYYYMSAERPTRQRIWLRSVQFSSSSGGGIKMSRAKPPQAPSTSTSAAARLRNLQSSSARLMRLPSLATLSKSPTLQALRTIPERTQHLPTVFQSAIQILKDDWNFKGFGVSLYKSFLFKKSFGFAFRIPLSTNWDTFERHPEYPRLSMSVAFFYPFTAVVTVGGSVNVEWVKWCVVQACITVRHLIALVLLSLARSFVWAGSILAYPMTGQLYQLPPPLLPPLASAFRQRPTFSTTLQERVGMSFSWRVSAKRGYEFRRTVWHLFLPTLLSLLQHVDSIQKSCQKAIKRKLQSNNIHLAGFIPVSPRGVKTKRRSQSLQQQDLQTQTQSSYGPQPTTTTTKVTTSSLMDYARNTKWSEFWLQRKTGSLGVSTGYPIPDRPHFSCSAVLSLSGFYFRPDTIVGGDGVTKSSTTTASADVDPIHSSTDEANEGDSPASSSSAMTASISPKKIVSSSVRTAKEEEEENPGASSNTIREDVKVSSASQTTTA